MPQVKIITSIRTFKSYAISHIKSRYKKLEFKADYIQEAWEHWYHKIIDYYYIKKKEIINSDIFFARQESVYMYSKGWNYKSVYSILIGTVFAFTTIWNFSFNNYESFSWIIGLIVSSIIYYLLASEQ